MRTVLHNRNGWSLVLLLFVMISFVAVFPLISTHLQTGSYSTLAYERWAQWQQSTEAAGSIFVGKNTVEQINIDYAPNANFSVSLNASATSSSEAVITTNTSPGGFATNTWRILKSVSGLEGAGTAADPWRISNAAELNKVRDYIDEENAYFTIVGNINLAEEPWDEDEGWEPIGTDAKPFKGNISSAIDTDTGFPYPVAGLKMRKAGLEYQGLFGVVEDATIDNLRLTAVDIQIDDNANYTGSLAGKVVNSNITNTYASGTVSGRMRAGGLIGEAQTTYIGNSGADVDVTGRGTYVGGLVGSFNSSRIFRSFATGNVTGVNDNHKNIGGLVGDLGYNGNIEESYATGDVTAEGRLLGGLVGNFFGGNGQILNSYATGRVASSYSGAEETGAGGLVGRREHENAKITNSYAVGSVEIPETATGNGSLIGINNSAGITNVEDSYYSYYEGVAADFSDSGAGIPAAGTEMVQPTTFSTWDFTSIWEANTTYPVLRNNRQTPAPEPPTAPTQFRADSKIVRVGTALYVIHSYTDNFADIDGTFDDNGGSISFIDLLIVGGGGCGGTSRQYTDAGSGGGGAGGLIFKKNYPAAGVHSIRVGHGGPLPLPLEEMNRNISGIDGERSLAFGLRAHGGGGGIGGNGSGGTGGSGGGSRGASGGIGNQPAHVPGSYGNNGGNSGASPYGAAGTGGGGAGGAAASLAGNTGEAGGPGGIGMDFSAYFGSGYGDNGWFAGGGGGGVAQDRNTPGPGAQGGGGNGASNSIPSTPGLAGTGSGGGGGNNDRNGAPGGSGAVLIRYLYRQN